MSMILATMFALALSGLEPKAEVSACNWEKADKGIQSELNICAHAEYLRADQELNKQWEQNVAIMRTLDEGLNSDEYDDGRASYYDALLASQRAWLKFRNTHCVNEGYLARGGSMESMLVSGCLTVLTEQRTKQLRELADIHQN